MAEFSLAGLHILVVEDEYLIADEIRDMLDAAGAKVLGPVPTVEAALARIVEAPRIDAAILDINLRGTMVFDVADALNARAVPFLFATGYDRSAIPDRFNEIPRAEKPLKARHVEGALATIMKDRGFAN
ncbi:response regulator [Sphingobium sp.]|uniref:response regulator n=1 Tax=Sphingobium sp. TaxID=1912891 RepID=UPI002C21EE94|nr:response regulator [Sphingobium sp.]HUD95317.1 response regulator [Sphingobium sp.]